MAISGVNNSTFSSLPKRALKSVNDLGAGAQKIATSAGSTIKKHTPDAIKNNKNAIVGSVVVLAAISSAVGIIKGLRSKIKEDK